ncbi:MAG: radical SAM protein [Ruminococcaceae bacterium]|nr:radical SAM protein [Oscillospiraceae bacterium]
MSLCQACPRHCSVDRAAGQRGYCGVDATVRIARCALHLWEEPIISGSRGSGTIFFAGCNLRCVYCQNYEVSHNAKGREMTVKDLGERMLELQRQGAHNINLVTPSHYAPQVVEALGRVRRQLYVPVVYNCGGYESVETIDALEGLVDIYMPDLKYYSPKLSAEYSGARDYFKVAKAAILRMQQQVGRPVVDGESGMMTRGLLVRHLVLPGCRKDSIAVMEQLSTMFTPDDFLLSLMSQYTPDFLPEDCPHENLRRRITSLEYESVVREVEKYGFRGFVQQRTSASAAYTPTFEG